MPAICPLIAYIGPETAFPAASALAAVLGTILMFGKSCFKLMGRWVRAIWRRNVNAGD